MIVGRMTRIRDCGQEQEAVDDEGNKSRQRPDRYGFSSITLRQIFYPLPLYFVRFCSFFTFSISVVWFEIADAVTHEKVTSVGSSTGSEVAQRHLSYGNHIL